VERACFLSVCDSAYSEELRESECVACEVASLRDVPRVVPREDSPGQMNAPCGKRTSVRRAGKRAGRMP